jgi:hypothetical protein
MGDVFFKLPNGLGYFDHKEPLNMVVRELPGFIADPDSQERSLLADVTII